jgi:hypothetical protein
LRGELGSAHRRSFSRALPIGVAAWTSFPWRTWYAAPVGELDVMADVNGMKRISRSLRRAAATVTHALCTFVATLALTIRDRCLDRS